MDAPCDAVLGTAFIVKNRHVDDEIPSQKTSSRHSYIGSSNPFSFLTRPHQRFKTENGFEDFEYLLVESSVFHDKTTGLNAVTRSIRFRRRSHQKNIRR